jgi:WD40 repeat protein
MRPVVFCACAALAVGVLPATLAAQGMPDLVWMGGGHIGISSIAVTPDGAGLLTAGSGDNTLKLWTLDDATLVRTLTAHYGMPIAVAIAPGGEVAASVGEPVFGQPDTGIKLWNLSTGDLLQTLPTDFQTGFSVAFSPDGTLLAAGLGYDVWVIRVADGAVLRKLTGHEWFVFGLAFSPDGTTLASASGDGTIKLWHLGDFHLLRTLTGHTFFVTSVDFHPGGETLVSGSFDGTVRLWRVADGAPLGTLTGHTDAVNGVAFSPDGTVIASASADHTVRLWSYPGGDFLRALIAPQDQYTSAVAFTPAGDQLISAGYDGKARLWEVATGALVRTFGHHAAYIHDIAFAPAGDFVATISQDITGRIWRAADGADLHTLVGHTDILNDLDVATTGVVATCAGSPPPLTVDPTIKLWRASDGALLRTLAGHAGGTTAVSFMPGGELVVSAGRDDLLKSWRVSDGAVVRTVGAGGDPIRELVHSPDGSVLAAATFGLDVKLWDARSGAFLRAFPLAAAPSAIAFSPDGSQLAVGLDTYGDNVVLLRTGDGAVVRTFAGDAFGFIHDVAYAPDGSSVVSTSGYTFAIRFWDPADGSLQLEFTRETGWGPWPALPLAFSPDGHTFAYGRADATVCLARDPLASTPVPDEPAVIAGPVLRAWPNPFTTTTRIALATPTSGAVTAVVLDARGRAVRRLAAAAAGSLAWDGHDDAGRRVAAGVYVVRVRDDRGLVASGKLVLTRAGAGGR